VTDFAYHLAVLTHGDAPQLPDVIDAFVQHVEPAPSGIAIYVDGLDSYAKVERKRELLDRHWTTAQIPGAIYGSPTQEGFCKATATLWQIVAQQAEPYVFWLEHDFVIDRDIDLRDFASILDLHPTVAQMTLMRDAYSREEHEAGGLFELRRGDFVACETCITAHDDTSPQPGFWEAPWMKVWWFSTNPSLMRRDFMVEHPLVDDGEPHCEGRYGVQLREQGFDFGYWGSGEVYCRHVGVRDGHGY
jgi:hypothetical protein